MITPKDILNQYVAHDSPMRWRELAAIHIHTAILAGTGGEHYRDVPEAAANLTVFHVNALAAELARTQVPVSPPSS